MRTSRAPSLKNAGRSAHWSSREIIARTMPETSPGCFAAGTPVLLAVHPQLEQFAEFTRLQHLLQRERRG